ncbi:MAG: SusC/RagA family TonB-linked outer membrane protein [Gemmatimonadaceae bacterium]|nr:SusC/RagA family TonB-linked outer membrane protein [Gemmatimonadaceae bacterium]
MGLIRRGATVLALLALAGGELYAQRRISGKVTEEGAGQPLGNVSVTVTGSSVGTYTNDAGAFTLTVPNGAISLRVRRIGYQLRTVLVQGSQSTVDVALKKDVLQLEGVTVTSQTTVVERKNAATAVSQVTSEQLSRVPAQQIDQALQGKVVGANINLNSGIPGGGAQIQIRGNTSMFGSGQPLFVIDGVLMSNDAISTGRNAITQASGGLAVVTSSQDAPSNRLADLNPNDVESIEVLKGAAASALYGSRATNGVVLITTKKGRSGAPRFNITQRFGGSSLLRQTGTRQFTDTATAFAVAANLNPASVADVRAATIANGGVVPFYDYQKDLYGRQALAYETVVSIDGGNDNTRYRAAITNSNNPGIAVNTGARRQAVRMNLDQNITSRITANVGVGVSRFASDRGLDGNDNTNTSPLYALAYTPALVDLRMRADGTFPENPFPGGGGSGGSNPFQTFQHLKNSENTYRMQSNARVDYQVLATDLQQLRFSAVGGIDRFDTDGQILSPGFLQYEPRDNLLGTAVQSQALSRQWNATVSGSYTINPSSLPFSATTVVGATRENQQLNVFRLQSRGLTPGVTTVGGGVVATNQTRQQFKDQALYLQQDVLAFDERLFLSAGIRADRSSAFGDPKAWQTYQKYQASYRLVNALPRVDELKLRGAIGESGNRPSFGDRDQLLGGNGQIAGINGFGPATTQGNPDIKPERMREIEFGFDGKLFGGRLGLEYTHFNRKISDALLPLAVAPTLGFGSYLGNGVQMRNVGNEVAVDVSVLQQKDLGWTSRVTYFNVKERVEVLPVPRFFLPNSGFGAAFGRSRVGVGLPTSNLWGRKMVYQPVLSSTGARIPNASGADSVTLQRVDTLLANATPKFQMSFFNNFTVGRFGLNIQVDYRKGGFLSNLTQANYDDAQTARDHDAPSPCRGFVAPTNPTVGTSTRCLLPGGAIAGGDTNSTMGQYRGAYLGAGIADAYVQDGSFVKLREVTLSYSMPASMSHRLFGSRANDVRLSFTGRNLFTSTPYWGADPEVNNFGNQPVRFAVDLAPFPPSRTFFFNIDVGF